MTVIPQKTFYGADTDLHGARLDVYLEVDEAESGITDLQTVFDIETENDDSRDAISALPKRVRFYHAKIDAKSLGAGTSYHALKNVVIIMIMPFDPFGRNRMVYSIRSLCEEEPSMPYDDGARTLFLYTRGLEGCPTEELRQLLRYLERTVPENARNEDLLAIQKMVETVKQDEEVSLAYMKIYEREEWLVRRAKQEEMVNTERERLRAEKAEARAENAEVRAENAEAEVLVLKEKIKQLEAGNHRG